MPDTPSYVSTINEYLEGAGLFGFSGEARKEIDAFFSAGSEAVSVPELVIEQGRALAHLNAAEYSLIPAFSNPAGMPLPPAGIVNVSSDHARLALLKGNCSLIIWTHAPARDRVRLLAVPDLAVFGGDASKLIQFTQIQALDQPLGRPQVAEYVEVLYRAHTASKWPFAAAVAQSGVLGLQGLLWFLKTIVVSRLTQEDLQNAIYEAMDWQANQLRTGTWR